MMIKPTHKNIIQITLLILPVLMFSCKADHSELQSSEILLTSESGDRLAVKDNVNFVYGQAKGTVLKIKPDELKQHIEGIGSSFTESSAFVLAHLDSEKREEVMHRIFGDKGAHFSLARTHIGACDFTVEGKYSYADLWDDKELRSFSIEMDTKGFNKKDYPGIKDETYDLLPMIREALRINPSIHIVASAWTAPAWMKDIEDWYIPGSPENNWQGTGGSLKKEYVQTYAEYLVKYLKAYRDEGVDIWALTPVNEPHGNNGQWESMHFSPESQNQFIQNHLGPALKNNGWDDIKLFVYDQNRDGLEHWAKTIFSDKRSAPFVDGAAIHWYESTNKVSEEVLEKVHLAYPEYNIIHTEGCIDDLGKEAPGGIQDPEGYKEENWFDNDSFWWNKNATDWAYTASWEGVIPEDHPMYTPVHRYARNIIVSLDHWVTGWIDWNIVLDKKGGPNHVGNYCGAPIMIDTETQNIYYTPIFYILSQFSRTIRPGDYAVRTERHLKGVGADDLYTCATLNSNNLLSVQVLNTTKEPIDYHLQIKNEYAKIKIPANSLQTVRIPLEERHLQKERPVEIVPHAVAYGFYRKGQAPGVVGPSEKEMLQDLDIITRYWDHIRIYGSDRDSEQLLDLIHEHHIPIKVMLGIWLENESRDPAKIFDNLKQIKKGIQLANNYPEIVSSVSVGNETQVYWSYHRMKQENLLKYIRMVRPAVPQPVTTADDYLFWLEESSQNIASELDFISTHIHPLWNGITLEKSISWIDSVYKQLKKIHPGKRIVIAETGWATDYDKNDTGVGAQGTQFREAPDEAQQKIFYHAMSKWAEKNDVMTYWFEIFDESWKGGGEDSSPKHAEKHWGLFYEDRTPKKVMKDL
jgi:glucosylceramidase